MTNYVAGERTGIQVHKGTIKDLEELRIYPRESYEDIVRRLIEDYLKHHKPHIPVDPPSDVHELKQEA